MLKEAIRNANVIFSNGGSYPTFYNELDFQSQKSIYTKSLAFKEINTLCLAEICKFLPISETKFFRMLNKKCSVAAEIAMHLNFLEYDSTLRPLRFEACADLCLDKPHLNAQILVPSNFADEVRKTLDFAQKAGLL